MSCTYLQQFRVPNCSASRRLMSPSVLEQLVFCHGEYASCPVYQDRETGVPIRKEMARTAEKEQELELAEKTG